MNRNRLLRMTLSLVLAMTMVFSPLMSCYVSLAAAGSTDQSVTEEQKLPGDATDSVVNDNDSAASDAADNASSDGKTGGADAESGSSAEQTDQDGTGDAEAQASDAQEAADQDQATAGQDLYKTDAESAEDAEDEETPVETKYVYQDNKIKVTATLSDASAIPDDARLVVTEVRDGSSSYDYDAYMDALNQGSDVTYDKTNTLLYDIAFIKDGTELQPAAGTVAVDFQFLDSQLTDTLGAESKADINVVHLPLKEQIRDQYDTTADAKKLDADDIVVEKVSFDGNLDSEKVTFNVSDFSVFAYTVDFEYTDPDTGKVYLYNLAGDSSISIKELAVILGITTEDKADEFVQSIESVEFSDESLVRVDRKLFGGWELVSLQPFHSDETLTIEIKDGSVITVHVTDVQESTDLTNFLTNVVITGATQTADGKYKVEQGKEYSIILKFAESSSYQFKNDGTLTYQMPDGITILSKQEGDAKISIVYKGKTYQVNSHYVLETDGSLKVTFDQDDPNYDKLVSSTNVSFNFSYFGAFDGSKDKIDYSDDIERDIEFDEPEPGQAYVTKTGSFDENTGKFTYTIKVTAKGDVTNVNVKDVISGNALKFNNDVKVSGNSSSYTDNGATNGFDYTFASMKDGEEITITYSADVDFTKGKDGKITVDQTKNTVTVKPDDGDPHSSDYSREIDYKETKKSDGKESGTTEDGDKIIEWTIDYNSMALAPAAGDTIKDTIASGSTSYMKYYGDSITVKVYNKAGTLVETRTVKYSDLTAYSDSSWTYTIPSTDTTPYHYVITYQTVVDMSAIEEKGTAITVSNDANGDKGDHGVTPGEVATITKRVADQTEEYVEWESVIHVPEKGLATAVVTDTVPHIWAGHITGENKDIYEKYIADSLKITGLLDGETYEATTDANGNVKIIFYKDGETGLKAQTGGHDITVRLRTAVDPDWLQKNYDDPTNDTTRNHTNKIDINGTSAEASAQFVKPDIEKKGPADGAAGITKYGDYKFLRYEIWITGATEEPLIISDTFNTELLKVADSSLIGGDKANLYEHMKVYGGDYPGQAYNGATAVSYSDTSGGITITANSLPRNDDGNYYRNYKIVYYLQLKDGVDLDALAVANGGEFVLTNTAKWNDHEASFDYKTKYDYLTKELLNEGEIGGTDRTAKYRITFNPSKATLHNGESMEMTDVLSANLSLDYTSIEITTDPAGEDVPYSIKGGDDGSTIVTYTVPDSTKVVIEYSADVRGDGTQKIINKVSVEGEEETITTEKSYGSETEGQGAVASFKIVKVDGYDNSQKLAGVQFKIFAENPNLTFNADGDKEITLTTNEDGELEFDGNTYTFYFDECYHVQEVAPPDGYAPLGFDYLVTLTNEMSKVDYGAYIYYYSDSMQIKNWPLEGLVVEKQVDSEQESDKTYEYEFRVSILKDDGTVDTDYNETNGDDEFVNGVTTFKLKDKEQKMFWGFKKGTKYKVEEIDANGLATTVTYKVFNEDGEVTEIRTDTGKDHTGTLTQSDELITFTNSKLTGGLKIHKAVTENGSSTLSDTAKSALAGTYTFTIYTDEACTTAYQVDGQDKTVTLTIEDDGAAVTSEEVTGLPEGDYWIKETEPTNGSSPVTNPVKVTVVSGKTGDEAVIANFTNNIETGSLKIKKNVTVNGAPTSGTIADGTYTFDVKDSSGAVVATAEITITNGVSNTAQVDHLLPGTYTVTEDTSQNPSGMSLTGDNDIEVVVEGGTTAEVKTAEFTNNRTSEASGEIKVKKTLTGRDWTDNDSFTFILSPVDNAPMPAEGTQTDKDGNKTITVTVTKDDEGYTKSFGEITFSKAGEYSYTVRELHGLDNAISYDTDVYTVTFTVTTDSDGNLVVTPDTDTIQTKEFENTYDAEGDITLEGNKKITGREFKDGDTATFTIEAVTEGAPLPSPSTVTINPTSGSSEDFRFGTIEYKLSDLGGETSKTFEYKVTETDFSMDGVTKDSSEKSVFVTVTDNGDGTLEAVIDTDKSDEIEFTNEYDAEGDIILEGNKAITGREFKDGDTATFKIEAVDPENAPLPDPNTVTINPTSGNSADFSFESINYKLSDLDGETSKTFEYKVTESAASMDGTTSDSSEKTVKIVVTDNGDGTLAVELDSENSDTIEFTNEYAAEGSIDLEGTKTIENRDFQDGDSWTFTVTCDDEDAPLPSNNPVTITPDSGRTATIDFGTIQYKLSDAGKTYTYTITESGTVDGVTNDPKTTRTVKISVATDGSKDLVVTKLEESEDISFTNTYDAEGEITLEGNKKITGREFKDGDTATFKIEAVTEGAPLPSPSTVTINPTSGSSEDFRFGTIEYKLSDLGGAKSKTFEYKVTESAASMDGVTKDSSEKRVFVTVTDNGDGTLEVAIDEDSDDIEFTNEYDAEGDITLEGNKAITGREFKDGDTATFKIEAVDPENAPLPDPNTVTINPTSGNSADFSFEPINYKLSDLDGETSKTFEYKVTESAASMDGTSKDKSEKTVKVTVTDNGDGTLDVALDEEGSDEIAFTNEYAAEGSIDLEGTKTIENRDFQEGDSWTFKIEAVTEGAPVPDPAEVTINPTSGSSAKITYGSISFTLDDLDGATEKTFEYSVTESGTVSGVTNDARTHTMTITVKDNGDGTLSVTKEEAGGGLSFTNKYDANGEIDLEGTKTIENRDFQEGDSWTFTVTCDDEGAPLPSNNPVTITPDSGRTATIDFGTIQYKLSDAGKTYTYTITESGTVKGVTNDPKVTRTVKISVEDVGSGELVVSLTDDSEEAAFTNTYDAKGEITLGGSKKITGREFKDGDTATFTIEAVTEGAPLPNPAEVTISPTSGSEESFSFGTIEYKLIDLGGAKSKTFEYKVTESAASMEGVTRDTSEQTIKVTVTDNGDGTLTASADKEASEVVFTNKYAAEGEVDLSALKVLSGRELKEGEFSFELKDADGKVLQTKSNASDGTVTFDTIKYTLPDVANSPFTYTISEVEPANKLGGVTYDTHEETITVRLVDNKDGTITATPDKNGTSVKFTNKYDAKGSIELSGTKTIENRKFKDGDTWTFEVSSDDKTAPLPTNNPVTITPTSGSSADIDYGKIEYKLSDLGGATTKVFNYTITETGSGSGVTNDTRTHTMAVTVTDNGDGTLDVSKVEENDGLSFTNTYDAEGKIVLAGTKNLTGRKFKAGDKWTFTISSDDADAPMPASDTVVIEPTSGTSESFSFGEIQYKLRDAGKTYTYTITESGTIAGVTNDPKVTRTVKVSVEDDGSGELVVSLTEDSEPVVFTNVYDAEGDITLDGSKAITGREFKDGDTATFRIEAINNAPLPKTTEVTINPAGGDSDTFTLGPIEYKLKDLSGEESNTFEYKITESTASMAGVTKDESVKTVKITVTDNGDGTLEVTTDSDSDEIAFTNTYSAKGDVVLDATKDLTGRKLKAGEFSFELKDADGNLLQIKTNAADGTVTFDKIEYNLDDVAKSPIKYTISEKIPSGAVSRGGVYVKDGVTYDGREETVTVTLVDNKDGTITATADKTGSSVKFTNTYDAEGSIDLTGVKTIENRKFKKGDKWTFAIEAVTDGAPMPDPGKVTIKPTDGYTETIEYGTVDFTLSDLGGKTEKSFKYKVTESGTVDGVTNDSRTHTVILTVKDNGDGTLSVTKKEKGGGLSFTNTYKPRKTVKTGDDTNLIAPVATFAISLILLIIAFVIFRRNRRNERAESDE